MYIYIWFWFLFTLLCLCITKQINTRSDKNDSSKISSFLLRSFNLLFFLRIFVPVMLLSNQRQSHGPMSDCACMCTYNKNFIENSCLWSITSQTSNITRRQRKKKKRKIDGDSTNSLEYMYIRFFNHSAWYQVFLFFMFWCTSSITERSNYEIQKKKKTWFIYIRHFLSFTFSYTYNMCAFTRSR
jgi:hypothetical protein